MAKSFMQSYWEWDPPKETGKRLTVEEMDARTERIRVMKEKLDKVFSDKKEGINNG